MKILHEEIKRLRLQKNISQVDMAGAAGMSRSAYISFEKNGSENLPLKSAVGIANKLDTSFNELFGIKGNSSADMKLEKTIEEKESKIKELQEVIQKNDQLIKLLQKENKELFKAKAGLELKENFSLYHETENKIRETKDEKETEKLRDYQKRVNGYFISKKISEIFDSGLLSRFEVLELIFENDIMVPEMYAIKEDLLESFTHHLNQFLEIGIEEVSTFLEKYEAKASRSG